MLCNREDRQPADPAGQVPQHTYSLVSLFTRHRNAANLVMVLMIIFGVFALGRINTQFFPTTEIPVITTTVTWSGASAEDVEANILEVLERRQHDISAKAARDQAYRFLYQRKFQTELEAWLQKIRDEAYVDIKV